jgi:hypothetical protein
VADVGPLITGDDVVVAVTEIVRKWMPWYLAEIERRLGMAPRHLPMFKSFVTVTDPDHWAEDQLPGCMVVAPGLMDTPVTRGDGKIEAQWQVAVAAVVSGQDSSGSFRLAQWYAACIRALMVQHQSLDGFSEQVDWVDEAYDDYTFEDARTMASGLVAFVVLTAEAVNKKRGMRGDAPDDPYTDPGPPHTVQSVFVSVDQEDF